MLESAERYPLELLLEVIRLCGGDEVWKVIVGEVREVVDYM